MASQSHLTKIELKATLSMWAELAATPPTGMAMNNLVDRPLETSLVDLVDLSLLDTIHAMPSTIGFSKCPCQSTDSCPMAWSSRINKFSCENVDSPYYKWLNSTTFAERKQIALDIVTLTENTLAKL